MDVLRNKVIRLAHDKPGLRGDLLPLLREAGEVEDTLTKQKFRNPDTGNQVSFKSLPKGEQARIRSKRKKKVKKEKNKVRKEKAKAWVSKIQTDFKTSSREVMAAVKAAPAMVQQFVADPEYRNKAMKDGAKAIKNSPKTLGKKLLKSARAEAKEFKQAGKAAMKVLKREKLDNVDKHALYSVGIYVGGTVLVAAGAGPLMAAGAFGKSFGAHVGIKSVHGFLDEGFLAFEGGDTLIHGIQNILESISHIASNTPTGPIASSLIAARIAAEGMSDEDMEANMVNYLTAHVHKQMAAGISKADMEKIMKGVTNPGSKGAAMKSKKAAVTLNSALPELFAGVEPFVRNYKSFLRNVKKDLRSFVGNWKQISSLETISVHSFETVAADSQNRDPQEHQELATDAVADVKVTLSLKRWPLIMAKQYRSLVTDAEGFMGALHELTRDQKMKILLGKVLVESVKDADEVNYEAMSDIIEDVSDLAIHKYEEMANYDVSLYMSVTDVSFKVSAQSIEVGMQMDVTFDLEVPENPDDDHNPDDRYDRYASGLRNKVIRLAHANPNLRADLLPLIKEAAGLEKALSQVFMPIQPYVKDWRDFLYDLSQMDDRALGKIDWKSTGEVEFTEWEHEDAEGAVGDARGSTVLVSAEIPKKIVFDLKGYWSLKTFPVIMAKWFRNNIQDPRGFLQAAKDIVENSSARDLLGKLMLSHIKNEVRGESFYVDESMVGKEVRRELATVNKDLLFRHQANDPSYDTDGKFGLELGIEDFDWVGEKILKSQYKMSGAGIEFNINVEADSGVEITESDDFDNFDDSRLATSHSRKLHNQVIRLAHSNPNLRTDLLPLLKESASDFQHGLNEKDILYSSWGYNQTNVDFYEVTAVRGKMIVIRKIESKIVGGSDTSDKVMPVPGRYKGKTLRKKPSEGYRGQVAVKITSYAYAYLWDGKPQFQTAAGYGH